MKKLVLACVVSMSFGVTNVATAASTLSTMVGNWKWEGFVIEVTKCKNTEICAKVLSGPKNVGLQMIKGKLKESDGSYLGMVAHPQTGDTYSSKLTMANIDTWHIDGCTPANVCASGDFSRIKK
ncbi:hypothetical protein MNBD_GAMMA07-572 [hydrothermal vent metagenome]|uniref:DUF2147 domain-containing protein n=1 Tax=hydrothermal vent metagenome TaxID=652676 RepID=A0A3B0WVG6_9ZZZZ